MSHFQTAVAEFREAVEELEDAGVPDQAEDFLRSVTGKVDAIEESVGRSGRPTDAQTRAIENMTTGVRKWLR